MYRSTARILRRVYQAGQLLARNAEHRVRRDAVQQVVFAALLLDDLGRFHGMHADLLVKLLAVRPALDRVHHDVLGGHKGQLAQQVLLDHLGVHHKTVGHVAVQVQDAVDRQKRFGNAQSLVRGIIERTLEPLGGGCDGGVQAVDDHIARQRRNALAAHRVALVRHGGGTDLPLLKGLLDLLHMLQKADVVRELGRALRDPAQNRQNLAVELSGIRLAGNGKAGGIPHLLRNLAVERLYALIIAVKQLQKAGLRAGGPLRAEQLCLAELVFNVLEVHQKILNPERGALADSGGLRGLIMRKRQSRQVFVLHREMRQNADDADKFVAQQAQSFRHDDNVGVVPYIAGGCPQMDDRARLRALLAIGIHMGHHVVAHDLLALPGNIVIDVVGKTAHFIDLLLRNGQAQLHFRLRQGDPKAAPGTELFVRRK